jgi:hypothetical protein
MVRMFFLAAALIIGPLKRPARGAQSTVVSSGLNLP